MLEIGRKLLSRKFLAWLIPVILGFVLVLRGFLTADEWWMFTISMASAYFSINLGSKNNIDKS